MSQTVACRSGVQWDVMPCRSAAVSWELFAKYNRVLLRFLVMCALLLSISGLAAAQGNPVRPLVTDRLDETRLVVLQGNTHPLALAQFDQGAAPPNLPMDRIMLVLKRSPEREIALQDLLEQQQDKSSPNYHKWVTPDQFGQQFGPADQDIQAVTSWLTSHGFQSIQVSKGRTVIEFSGTAAQVESALRAPIRRYVVNGENHWANASDPQIPAALAPVVSGVVSLHDFRRKPLFARSGRQATATVTLGAKPQVNFGGGAHAMGPADFNVLYNVAPTMTGNGTTIAVVARSNISVPDVTKFRSIFGLSLNDPIVVVNGPNPGDLGGGEEVEAVLDATWSGAVAPSAVVKLVVSQSTNSADGVDLSEIYVIDNNLGDVMTESFGTCEMGFTASQAANLSTLAQQAAAQGITYMVSSGDSGPDGCDDPNSTPTTLIPASVNILASTPFTVAVGGTQFNENGNASLYWNSTNAANTLESAKSYIPENVWNESCNLTQAQCAALATPLSSGLWSSSGGVSTLFTKPSWQAGVAGIPADGARDVPDVSVTAADHDGYLICLAGSCQGSNPSFPVISGTSASVQAFGGIVALVVQKTASRQGQANYVFYKLAAGETLSSCNGSNTSGPPNSSCIFNDTTVGNTNLYANSSTPAEAGFSAGVGYDEATGLGSVNVTNLVNQWNTAINKGSTTTLSLNNGSAVNITHAQSVPVNITVAAKTPPGTPTGNVSLLSSTSQGLGSFTLTTSGGNGTFTGATTLLPGGTYTVTAHYAGDGTFLASDSAPPISVTVAPEASKTVVAIVTPTSANAPSVTYGSGYLLTVTVTNAAGSACNPSAGPACPTGTATLTDNGNPLGGTLPLTSLGIYQNLTQLTAGPHNIVASYGGNSSFAASTSSADVVAVSQAATTATAGSSVTSAVTGASVTLTATVVTQSDATANAQQEPTGTVQFFLGGVAFGSPVAVTGGVNTSTQFAQATASLTTTTLPNGQDSITAQYSGDNNYSASSASPATVVTVGPDFTISASAPTVTVGAGNPAAVTLTITGTTGYTGTIAFSAASCSNLPAKSSCSFNPSSVTGDGSTVLTIFTTSALLAPQSRPMNVPWPMAGVVVLAVACVLGVLALFVPRRRLLPLSGFLMFACLLLVCGGCKPGAMGTFAGTPRGGSIVAVTAVAGGISHTVTFTLNIQ